MNFNNELNKFKIFELVGKISDELNLESYVIGGFVRDLLLNRQTHDIDIVCVGDGIILANAVAHAIGKNTKIAVYKNYGTAMLQYENCDIEFVGARKESYQQHSRNPIVTTGTLETDQRRRDFTINAMAIGINARSI